MPGKAETSQFRQTDLKFFPSVRVLPLSLFAFSLPPFAIRGINASTTSSPLAAVVGHRNAARRSRRSAAARRSARATRQSSSRGRVLDSIQSSSFAPSRCRKAIHRGVGLVIQEPGRFRKPLISARTSRAYTHSPLTPEGWTPWNGQGGLQSTCQLSV